MGGRDREVYSGVHGQREITKGKMKRKGKYKSVEIQKKSRREKRKRAGQVVLEGRKGQG